MTPPTGLAAAEFVLRPIVETDAARDFAAVIETRHELRLWSQSDWPTDDFTVEDNRADVVGLEERHRAGRAFTYTVVDPEDTICLGCVYVFPTTATFLTKAKIYALTRQSWEDVEAVVYFWVRTSRVQDGLGGHLLAALRDWFRDEWKSQSTVFVTSERCALQVDLLRAADLRQLFELREPDKDVPYLGFGEKTPR